MIHFVFQQERPSFNEVPQNNIGSASTAWQSDLHTRKVKQTNRNNKKMFFAFLFKFS